MIIQEQPDLWDSSLLAELAGWERRVITRPASKKNKRRRVVQLVSSGGRVFTSSSSLFSFLQQNKRSGGSVSEEKLREEIRELFRLREKERVRLRTKQHREKISLSPPQPTITTLITSHCDHSEGPDFSQLLPSEPLSQAELSKVERITTREADLVTLSEDLDDLDDIDYPRLEEEKIICDVPLTFREEVRGRNYYLDWYNYLEDPNQLTEVTEEKGEEEEHMDHNYHIRPSLIERICEFYLWERSEGAELSLLQSKI